MNKATNRAEPNHKPNKTVSSAVGALTGPRGIQLKKPTSCALLVSLPSLIINSIFLLSECKASPSFIFTHQSQTIFFYHLPLSKGSGAYRIGGRNVIICYLFCLHMYKINQQTRCHNSVFFAGNCPRNEIEHTRACWGLWDWSQDREQCCMTLTWESPESPLKQKEQAFFEG